MTKSQRFGWGLMSFLLMLAIVGCGGGSGSNGSGGNNGGGGGGGTPPPANQPPRFTSAASVTVAENTAGVFYTATATDPDGDALTFSLSGGADRDRFSITTSGGLSFVSPPDFEAPADSDRNNVYQVEISVSDGKASATLSLSVTVTDVADVGYRVRRVATGLDQPVFLAPVPDGSGRVFVVELAGRIRILTPSTGAVAATPFLDISSQITMAGERGLLGFATAPDFRTSGVFYIFVTPPSGRLEIRRYRTMSGDRNRADPASASLILGIPHSDSYHNGGWIGFSPAGLLYMATGDNGDSGLNNPQNPNILLGKILRIDPSRDDFPADTERNYGIPAGNPFASGGGAPEVLALGLRNPFRNAFDPVTGNLWIGDVGQDEVEEIDLLRPTDSPANFGWPIFEGTQRYPYYSGTGTNLIPPVAEYRHGGSDRQGNSVIGGHVYRGPIEQLQGQYVFADFIVPNIWTIPISRVNQGSTLPASEFTVRNGDFTPNAGSFNHPVGFGVDESNNLYLLDMDGEVFVIEPRS